MGITLYNYWRSSASYRVRLALHYKGLSFQYVPVNLLAAEQTQDAHKTRNPTGYVPAIEIDGRWAAESVAILELLDVLYPEKPLYPREPWAAAYVRQLVETINSGIQPLHNLNVVNRLPFDADGKVEWSKHFITKGLTAVEALLSRRANVNARFAVSDEPMAVDMFITPQLYGARRNKVDLSAFPLCVAADEAVRATEFGKAALPENQIDATP